MQFDNSCISAPPKTLPSRRTLLLIESMPTYGESKGCSLEQIRRSIQSFLTNKTTCPAILIFSDVTEKNECAPALEKFFGRDIMSSPVVECIEFNPITSSKCVFFFLVSGYYFSSFN